MISVRSQVLAASLLLLLATTIALVFGCEAEGENVTVQNSSSETVVVFEDGVPLELVHPAVTKKFHILRFSRNLSYSVQSFESREVLAERTFTWDEIVHEDGIEIVLQ